jgi:imidazolonepropionase-like amidohydrolase
VNAPAAQIAIASAKRSDNKFAVNALSTDGGNIPRNTTLKKGLLLVEFGVFTLEEFVRKACCNPAGMLGVEQRKGHLGQGADADVIIVDPVGKQVETVISGGKITFDKGGFYPAPNNLISLNGNHVESGEQIHAAPSWLFT